MRSLSSLSLCVDFSVWVSSLFALATEPSVVDWPLERQIQFITGKPSQGRLTALVDLIKQYKQAGTLLPLKLASLSVSVFKEKEKLLRQVVWLAGDSLVKLRFGSDALDLEPAKEQRRHLKFVLDYIRTVGCAADSVRVARILHALKGAQRFDNLGYSMPLDCYSQWLTVPGLRSKPFWDVADFPFLLKFAENYEDVKRELKSVLTESKKWTLRTDHGLVDGSVEGWTEHALLLAGNALEQECESFPKTCGLLTNLPDWVMKDSPDEKDHAGQATIFRLTPGTNLKPHVGATNRRLTAHLGLVIPEGPRLRVENETRHWRQGEFLVFDDSFRHEVWWEAQHERRDRYVLSLTFLHPDLWHETADMKGDEL